MFVYSAKMDKKKLAVLIVCILVVVLALVFVFSGKDDEPGAGEDAVRAEQIELLKSARLSSEEDMREMLTELGWQLSDTSAESDEVMIPSEFSEVYESYNDIQKAQGLDLEKYRGKTVGRYTFVVLNHPSGEDVRLTLLVYKNRVIGGDVCTPRLDGFMHGLLMSDAEAYSNQDIGEAGGDNVIASEYGENTSEDSYPSD